MREFSAIDTLTAQQRMQRPDVMRGIGDDAAVLAVPAGGRLVVSMDTLVAGVHYPEHTPAQDIGYKLLAVNLSDMAAMGAEPAWATLAMSLPALDPDWLRLFMSGFYEIAQLHHVQLIGGDTTRSPVPVFTVQMHGWMRAAEQPLLRCGARPGERIYVSGSLGDAALALALLNVSVEPSIEHESNYLRTRLNRPAPRVQLGRALLGVASSCIDISDGLLADLDHILQQSGVGAVVDLARLPRSPAFSRLTPAYAKRFERSGRALPPPLTQAAQLLALTGGDDYELCFTAPAVHAAHLEQISRTMDLSITDIGEIVVEQGVWLRADAALHYFEPCGYEHFAAT